METVDPSTIPDVLTSITGPLQLAGLVVLVIALAVWRRADLTPLMTRVLLGALVIAGSAVLLGLPGT